MSNKKINNDLSNVRYEYGPGSEQLFSQMEERLVKLKQSVLMIEQELMTLSNELNDTREAAREERGVYLS